MTTRHQGVRSFSPVKQGLIFLWILLGCFGMLGSFQKSDAVAAEVDTLYDAKGRRDPFVQLVNRGGGDTSAIHSVETADELLIEGIASDTKGSLVIVNGTVMREGEESGQVKVLKISKNGALFSVNGIDTFKEIYQDKQK